MSLQRLDLLHGCFRRRIRWRFILTLALAFAGVVDTPMRKLIRNMPEMAELVLDKCIVDNGKVVSDDDFSVSVHFKL